MVGEFIPKHCHGVRKTIGVFAKEDGRVYVVGRIHLDSPYDSVVGRDGRKCVTRARFITGRRALEYEERMAIRAVRIKTEMGMKRVSYDKCQVIEAIRESNDLVEINLGTARNRVLVPITHGC
jgi:hypothetical protein